MRNWEKQRVAHLLILVCCTVFIALLIGESTLLGWEAAPMLLLVLGVIGCWAVYVTERLTTGQSLWLTAGLSMLAFFYYGSHETSLYDLAPVMIFIIVLFSAAESERLIYLCTLTYCATMLYGLLFSIGDLGELTALVVTRTLLHFVLVLVSSYIAVVEMRGRRKERGNLDTKIAELEETNRRTEDFLTNVSHELRTPVNAVIGVTATMLKEEENEEKKKHIRSVEFAGYRLFGQIEDILDYTEIDTGRMKVSEDNYMISSVVNDVIAAERMVDREKRPELVIDLDANVPSVLYGDARKIKKILRHLLDNAQKFTKEGGVYVRVYTIEKPYGVNLCIRVSDTGIGIEGKDLQKITEKFYQSSQGRNRRAGGLGLGLSIVYGLTSALEGFVRIESTPGEGTSVYVSIPQKVADRKPTMIAKKREGLCLAFLMRPEKFAVPEVRNYYNEIIGHLSEELKVTVYRATDIDELKRIAATYNLTHLFLGNGEYDEYREYVEQLDPMVNVAILADADYKLTGHSRARVLRKPLYSLSVVNLLNAGGAADDGAGYEGMEMRCPGVRALVVDDEAMNLMVAENIFKGYGMIVRTAKSGPEALAVCEKETFDIIFLDHMMPEMDGVETLKRLRKQTMDRTPLTVVAFTANAVSGAREMFLAEGFDEFVSKPIEKQEFERVLRIVLPKSAIVYGTPETKESAPESEQANAPKDPFEAGLLACGIYMAQGLQHCQGDKAFYKELLQKFAEDGGQKPNDLERFFSDGDLGNYRILVHAVKSTAKMIGASELSAMAKAAEDAAKDGDADYIRAHGEELLDRYRSTVGGIYEALGITPQEAGVFAADETQEGSGESEADETQPDGAKEPGMTEEEFTATVGELKSALDTFEGDRAGEVLKKLQAAGFGGETAELLTEIGRDIDDFEFETAAEKAERLLSQKKGGETA